jgi:hypothetical protein
MSEDSDLCVGGHRNSLLPRLGQNKISGRIAGRRARDGIAARDEAREPKKIRDILGKEFP